MTRRWVERLPGGALGLLVPAYLIGAITLGALAGITPWRSAGLALELGPPVRLLGFWTLLAAMAVAAYGGLVIAWAGLVRKRNEPWPWTAAETGVALVVALVVIGISSETLPANFIKAGGFQLLLPAWLVVALAATRARGGSLPAGLVRSLLVLGGVTFAFLIFNLAVTGDVSRGALLLNRLWAYTAWFLALGLVLRPGPGLEHLRSFLIALGLGVTGYGILQHFGLDWAQWGRGFSLPDLKVPGRAMSSFGNPNFYGAFLVVMIPLVIGRYLAAVGRTRLLGWGAALAGVLAGLLLTYNRSGYLAAAVALGLLLWRLPAHRRRLGVLVGVLALGFLVGPASVRDRMLFWRNGLSGDDQIRSAIWRATMNMALDRPWLGHGVGTFNQSSTRYLPYEFHRIYPAPAYVIEHAHSELLEWWAETGAIGSALVGTLLLAVTVSLGRLGRLRPEQRLATAIALAALAAGVTHGLLETKLRYESTAVPLLLILAAALVQPRPAAVPRPAGFRPLLAVGAILGLLAMSQGLVWLRANQEMKIELDRAMGNQWPAAREAIARAARFDPENLYVQYKHLYYWVTLNETAGRPLAVGSGRLPAVVDYQDGALLLAKDLAARGAMARALDCLERYRLLHPRDERGALVRAEVLTKGGCPRGVLETLARLVSDKPEYVEQAIGLRAQAWMTLGRPDLAREENEQGIRDWPELVAPRLTLLAMALEKKDLASAWAQLAETIPRLGGREWPPTLRRLVERFVNQVASDPAAGKRYAVLIGDLLAEAKQYQQAKIVYLRLAGKLGVAPETVWSRVGWLGLVAGDSECLALAARAFETSGTRLTAAYLQGRYLEMKGETEPALAVYAALLAKQPLHLGALARIVAVPGASRSPALQMVAIAAEATLGLPLERIDTADSRWIVAALPAATDTSARAVWITPIFPDGENPFRVLMAAPGSGAERYGPGAAARVPVGGTTRMMIPGPVFDTLPPGPREAEQVLYCRGFDQAADARTRARYDLGFTPLVLASRDRMAADAFWKEIDREYQAWTGTGSQSGLESRQWDWLASEVNRRMGQWRIDAAHPNQLQRDDWQRSVVMTMVPAWRALLTFTLSPERLLPRILLGMTEPGIPSGAISTLAYLDMLIHNGVREIPPYLWSRPHWQGWAGNYWERWATDAIYRKPEFRRAIGDILVRERRYDEAVNWLTTPVDLRNNCRLLLAYALTGLGKSSEAEELFRAAPAAERATPRYSWEYGQWRKSRNLPVAEQVRLLEAQGADGWASLLNGNCPPGAPAGFEPVEYESGLWLAGMDSIAQQLEAGEKCVFRVWVVPDEPCPEGLTVGVSIECSPTSYRGGDWGRLPTAGKRYEIVPELSIPARTPYQQGTLSLHPARMPNPYRPELQELPSLASGAPVKKILGRTVIYPRYYGGAE